jgi:hypothetical protein
MKALKRLVTDKETIRGREYESSIERYEIVSKKSSIQLIIVGVRREIVGDCWTPVWRCMVFAEARSGVAIM